MCGVIGFIGPPDPDLLARMTSRLLHRGPDDEGYLERPFASLAHRRLAVIDPEHGHQPMSNPEGNLHIVYNGEVHNFRELRQELESEGYSFSTACDTEVVLRAYEAWGTQCFPRFNGMWALAIMDERNPSQPTIVLSRDHLGVKPLYLATAGGRLLFASEIKALLACEDLQPEPDEEHLAHYLLRGLHAHDEGTFFAGVHLLPPATAIVITADEARTERSERYWTPRISSDGPSDPAAFRAVLTRAVERRLIADLTVGTCLSGGLDSSTIVTLMSELMRSGAPDASSIGERLKTFSAVFDGDPIDEQRWIEPVLEASGAESHYVRPRSSDLFADFPIVAWHQDEPMVSSGPYAQFRVMALARSNGTQVLLDGQGGDELLAGYVPHQYVYLRELVGRRQFRAAAREAFAARDVLTPLVRQRVADRRKPVDPAAFCSERVTSYAGSAAAADHRTYRDLKTRLLQDLMTYSLPPMMRNEDRNAMAHAIESRPPFLDQELVEFVLALPADAIVRDGWSRWILREAMRGTLPEIVRTRRKKIGFTTPEMRWLRAERTVVTGIFRSPAFCARPYWDAPAISRAFQACCEGRLEESSFFWRALNAEAWLRLFHGSNPLSPAGKRPEGTLQQAGDEAVPELVGQGDSAAAVLVLDAASANDGRHLFACGPDGRAVWARVPIRTPLVETGDDLDAVVLAALAEGPGAKLDLLPGDVVAISAKAVLSSQGGALPLSSVQAGPLARTLSRVTSRTLGETGFDDARMMQLAIQEVGAARIAAASLASAAVQHVAAEATFVRLAGQEVRAIDGPRPGALPPFDTFAKLPPADADGVALRLSRALSQRAGGSVEVAVVDSGSLGVNVLGTSRPGAADGAEVQKPRERRQAMAGGELGERVAWLLGDNPLGPRIAQTPVALLREIGRLP